MQPLIVSTRLGAIPLLLALALAAGCSDPTATPGPSFQVSVTTTGVDLDPDGYVLVITGDPVIAGNSGIAYEPRTTRSLGVNGTIVVRDVPAGGQTVLLDGIAANCRTTSAPYQTISVGGEAGGSPSVAFSVSCFTRSIPPALAATQLLFRRGPPDESDAQIYRTRADGTGLVALGSGRYPVWSPDGRRIAFVRVSGVYVMDADGANVQHFAGDAGTCPGPPTWSPDGRRLAFGSGCEYGPVEITVVSLDGSSAPVIIPNSWDPAWSPDGSRIAFAAFDQEAGAGAVWTVAPDGSDRRLLAYHDGLGLAWSPDGRQIALGGSGVAVMNADGSGLRQLTTVAGFYPTWSPDGQAIAFHNECWELACSWSVFYVTADGTTTGLLIEDGAYPSWHK